MPQYLSPQPELPDTWEVKLWKLLDVSDDTIRQWLERRQVQSAQLRGLEGHDVLGGYSPQNPTGSGIVAEPPSTRLQQGAEGVDKLVELVTAMGGLGPASPKFGAEPAATPGARRRPGLDRQIERSRADLLKPRPAPPAVDDLLAKQLEAAGFTLPSAEAMSPQAAALVEKRGGVRPGSGRPKGSTRAPQPDAAVQESRTRTGEPGTPGYDALTTAYEQSYADVYRNMFGSRSGDPKVEKQRAQEVADALRQPTRQGFLARTGAARGGTLATRSQEASGEFQKEGRMLRPEEQKNPIKGASLEADINQLYEKGAGQTPREYEPSAASAERGRIPVDAKVIQATEVAQGKGRRSLMEIEQELAARREANTGTNYNQPLSRRARGAGAPADEASADDLVLSYQQALDEGLSPRNVGRGTRDSGKGNKGTRVLPPKFHGRPMSESGQPMAEGGEASYYGEPGDRALGDLQGIRFELKPPNKKRVAFEKEQADAALAATTKKYASEPEASKTQDQRGAENTALLKARSIDAIQRRISLHARRLGLFPPVVEVPYQPSEHGVARRRPLTADDVATALETGVDYDSEFARDLGGYALADYRLPAINRLTPDQVSEARIALARQTGVLPTAPETLAPDFGLLGRLAQEPIPATGETPQETAAVGKARRQDIAALRADRNRIAEHRRSGSFTSEEENAANESLRALITQKVPKGMLPLIEWTAEIDKASEGVKDKTLLALAEHLKNPRPKSGLPQVAYDTKEEALRVAVENQFENRHQTPAQRALAEHIINPRPTDKASGSEYDALTRDLTAMAKEEGKGSLTPEQKAKVEEDLASEMKARRTVQGIKLNKFTGAPATDAEAKVVAEKEKAYPYPGDANGPERDRKPGANKSSSVGSRYQQTPVNPDAGPDYFVRLPDGTIMKVSGAVKKYPNLSGGGETLGAMTHGEMAALATNGTVARGELNPDVYLTGGHVLPTKVGLGLSRPIPGQGPELQARLGISAVPDPRRPGEMYRTGALNAVMSNGLDMRGLLQRLVDQGAEAVHNAGVGKKDGTWRAGPLGSFVRTVAGPESEGDTIVRHGQATAKVSPSGEVITVNTPSYIAAVGLFKALKALGVSEAQLSQASLQLFKQKGK